MDLSSTSVTHLKGVGTQLAAKLERLGIQTIQHLLFHLPSQYQDRSRLVPIARLKLEQSALIEGTVIDSDVVFGRRRSLYCRLRDASGEITLRFFHFSKAQQQGLAKGQRLRCYGEVRLGRNGLEMYHPEYQQQGTQADAPPEYYTPTYPLVEGLSQARLRGLIAQALKLLHEHPLAEWLPRQLLAEQEQTELNQAVRLTHQPPIALPLERLNAHSLPEQRRLAYEELLAHHLSLLRLRQRIQAHQAEVFPPLVELQQQLLHNLPFSPTADQLQAVADIHQDLQRPAPMLRLVQGDVGAGKTLVAALAALPLLGAGAQVAIMAPTEILAEQHAQAFNRWWQPLGFSTALLTSRLKGKARKHQLQAIAAGDVAMVVGTHALFQADVAFQRLGLVIIDEQHRFGVHQRLALREKGRDGTRTPHQLIMTATPIPRTLAMSAYADLDCSVIRHLPPGRQPIETVVLSDSRRDEVIAKIRQACADHKQTYWVCTLVEESELLQCQAAEDTAATLRELFAGYAVGLVHGRMKDDEKQAVMKAFAEGELAVLVATTVIEVGVDVPNASLMVIENPERLGLAQLHQLRGRVGRGSIKSYCILMYHAPLSQRGKQRLQVMRESTDGFYIAQKDLEIRGPGEVLGTRQTGQMQFRMADLLRDEDLLPAVKAAAEHLLNTCPEAVDPLIQRWLAENEKFATV